MKVGLISWLCMLAVLLVAQYYFFDACADLDTTRCTDGLLSGYEILFRIISTLAILGFIIMIAGWIMGLLTKKTEK